MRLNANPMAVMLLVAAHVLAASVVSAEWSFSTCDPGPTVWCRWVSGPVRVDGRLEEWNQDDFQIVLDGEHMTGENHADPPVIGGDADCSGQVAMAWDGTFLFVALRARDDVLAPVDVAKGYSAPWFHDGLMLMLHAHAGLAQSGRYGRGFRSEPSARHATLGLSYYQPDFGPRELPGRSQYVARSCPGGYELEAAIELKALGYRDPLPGDRLKLSLILVDRDPGAEGADAFGQLIWHMGPPGASGDPRNWADLRLMRDGWGADMVGCVQREAGAMRLRLKGTLDVQRPDVVFRGVRLFYAAGKVLQEVPASQAAPEGCRLVMAADVKAPALAGGTYEVHVVVQVGGQEHNQGTTTLLKVPQKNQAVQAPGPVCVPDPTHFALSARSSRPPTLKNITRETYLEFLKEHTRRILEALLPSNLKKPWRHSHQPGFLAAYMYKQTKDPFYAEAARAALESAIGWTKVQDKEGAFRTHWHWLMVHFMRQSGLLTQEDEPRIRQFLLTVARRACKGHYDWEAHPWRRGAGHSSLGPAVARYYAVHFYPDIAEAEMFRKYYELTWNDWWKSRDTIYNDTGYRSLLLNHIFLCAYLTGRDDLFKDKEAMKFWERLLHTSAPCGAVPHYGDTNGWSTEIGMYAFYFEYLAAKTRDGRFKYAAHRIFDYIVNHSVDVHDYHMQRDEMVYGIALAHMVADDSVEEKEPERRSLLLTRKELVYLKPGEEQEEFGHQIYGMVLGQRDIPDKIVFKSDNRDTSLWAMIDVCPRASHNDVPEPTNVAALMDQESVLTCNQGYMDETPDLHNVLLAEGLEGTRFEGLDMKITVPEFYDRHYASYARVRVENYQGWPIDEERQFLFGRYRFLLMKDVVKFNQTWMCRIGPCWQAQQVGPEIGPNWANTYVRNLFLSGIGQGRGVHRWKNPAWDVLVFHPPKKDCTLEIINRLDEQPWRLLPVRLRYAWEGMGRKGQRMHFTTLLLPHEPVWKPSELVEKISVLADTPDLTALHVATDRHYEDWMLLNDTGGAVQAAELETDARQLHLSLYDGKGHHVMAEGGTFVKFRGKQIVRVPAGQRIDQSF